MRSLANSAHAATTRILVELPCSHLLATALSNRGMAPPSCWGARLIEMSHKAHIMPTRLRYRVTLGTTNPLDSDSGETNVTGTRNTVRTHSSSIVLVTCKVQGLANNVVSAWDVINKQWRFGWN